MILDHESSEETLRAIIEANFALCYEWELSSGRTRFWGKFDQLLGLSPDATPTSIEGWLDLLHPEDRVRVIEKNQQAIREFRPYLDEYRMIHQDGSQLIISDSGHILADHGGMATKMVGGIRDVTQEREMQRALEERNIALKVILDQRERDKLELERNVNENVRILIIPALERITRSLGNRPEVDQLEILRQTLEEIAEPFAGHLGTQLSPRQPFTRRELEIIDLIRKGKTTPEISNVLFLTDATVSYHRTNIRKKLSLPQHGPRLETYLRAKGDVPPSETAGAPSFLLRAAPPTSCRASGAPGEP